MTKVSPVGRLKFSALYEPYARNDKDKKKYEAVLWFEKKTTDIAVLREVEEEAVEARWGSKRPPVLRSGIRDGDKEVNEKTGDLLAPGYWVVKFSSQFAPGVVDRNKKPIPAGNADGIYNGCNARVSFSAYTWEYEGTKKGVSFNLEHFQKVADNEKWGGKAQNVDDAFDDDLPEVPGMEDDTASYL